MKFGEKVRELRKKAGMTQEELAKKAGIGLRTLKAYENGERYPKKREVYGILADILGVKQSYLLAEDEEFITTAAERYGASGQKDALEVLRQAAAVFAGGEVSEEDKLAFMHEIQALYLESKEIAKEKFTPRKYKDSKES